MLKMLFIPTGLPKIIRILKILFIRFMLKIIPCENISIPLLLWLHLIDINFLFSILSDAR